MIPIICIPTTLSGGDYSTYAGVTNAATSEKFQFCPPLASPSLIIWSPSITIQTPIYLWLQSGIRSVDHCVEALAYPQVTPEIEEACITGLKLLIPGLLKSHDDEKDTVARFSCQMGVMHAMLPLHRFQPAGASHGIGHMLGPLCGVGHGETSCILLPAVCKYNARYGSPDVQHRQKIIRDLLYGFPEAKHIFKKAGLQHHTADLGDLIDAFVRALGLPRSLHAVGVGRERFANLAANSLKDPFLATNPVPVSTREGVLEILDLCA